MIRIYSAEEIELIRESSLLVGKTLAEVAKHIAPGVKTITLDKIAEDYIRSVGATPGFKGYEGFPYALCISVNEIVVHGFPSEYELKEGDIVSIDCGVYKNGFHGDSAYTFAVGQISEEVKKLLQTTKESLYKGIEQAKAGNRIGDIGYAIQKHCEAQGYGVVRELIGHGVGAHLHEKPDVPNFGKQGSGKRLQQGMVIAIEPMITMGTYKVSWAKDGWGVYTEDKLPAAHYEHDVVIGKDKAEILSSFDEIEKIING
ncbi:MAG: type I methionyl aminopeptidase [Bacteroidales bacterium]|nr:type I methionyl aminopeptidase [Bacteroidales bacterium]